MLLEGIFLVATTASLSLQQGFVPDRSKGTEWCCFVVTMDDMDIDADIEDGDGDNPPTCLTGFSSVASVGNVLVAEESRDLSTLLSEIASDSDEDELKRPWGGSMPGKSPNIPRDFQGTYERLLSHYFKGDDSLYTEAQFRRRFRVSSSIFQRVCQSVFGKGCFYPPTKKDATGKAGIHPLVRTTAVFRMIAYGTPADCQDEQWQIGETTIDKAMKCFCRVMIQEFGDHYLNRTPSLAEKNRILAKSASRGFPGCFASWDCKHFVRDKCPVALQGQHKGHADGGKYTKILEAIADDSCYLWFVNFGDPGSLNDINVLDKSSIVGALISGNLDLKTEPYTINGNTRDWMYFLADGIYPDWAIFVKTISRSSQRNKNDKRFAQKQEAFRKDIERAFGILVKKFHIIARPIRYWREETIRNLLYTCVILHNMVVEERIAELGHANLTEEDHARYYEASDQRNDNVNGNQIFAKLPAVGDGDEDDLEDLMTRRFARANSLHHLMTNREMHVQLKKDLYVDMISKRRNKKT